MTRHFWKTKGAIWLMAGIFGIFVISGLILSGCSSKSKSEKELPEETGTLPEESNKTLLDTTTTQQAQPPTQGQVAQKPATPKPRPRPAEGTTKTTEPAKPTVTKTLVLNENATMKISLMTQVSTDSNQVGDQVRAMVKGPATQGETLNLPDGTILNGEIAELNNGKAEGQKAFIKIRFTGLVLPGEQPIPMEGYIITSDGTGVIRPGAQGTSIARDAGIGAVAGGLLGAVAGGKTKDAIKGAVAGGAAGAAAGALLHKDQVTLKQGREFDVKVAAPVYQEKIVKGI